MNGVKVNLSVYLLLKLDRKGHPLALIPSVFQQAIAYSDGGSQQLALQFKSQFNLERVFDERSH